MPKFAVQTSLESIALETTNVLGDSRAFIVDAFKETLRKNSKLTAVVYCVELCASSRESQEPRFESARRPDPILQDYGSVRKVKESKSYHRAIRSNCKVRTAIMETIESRTASLGLTLNIPKTSANVSAGAASLAYWATQILKKACTIDGLNTYDRAFQSSMDQKK